MYQECFGDTASVALMRRRNTRKQNDIAGRKSSRQRDLTGEFLEGTESSVDKIEATTDGGFHEAWGRDEDPANDRSIDNALNVSHDDSSARDLEKSRLPTIAGWLVFAVGLAAIAFLFIDANTGQSGDLGARASADLDRNILASPLDAREYSDLESPVDVALFARLSELFVGDPLTGELATATDGNSITGQFRTGPVFWAGRVHVAVLSNQDLLANAQECIVTSLVTTDLVAVDVASAGACDATFGATGDRIACRGDRLVIFEVWPFNPDALGEPEVVSSIRTRIERRVGETVDSRRGAIELTATEATSQVVSSATTLNGAPGDTITIQMGELVGSCDFVDRANVDVRLLPG